MDKNSAGKLPSINCLIYPINEAVKRGSGCGTRKAQAPSKQAQLVPAMPILLVASLSGQADKQMFSPIGSRSLTS